MNDIIKAIKDRGYIIGEDEDTKGFAMLPKLSVISPDGKRMLITRMKDGPIYFSCGVKNAKDKDMDEIEELVEAGEILKTSAEELYRAYYAELTDDEFSKRYSGYSLRAKHRIEKERQLLNHIESKYGWTEEQFPGDTEKIDMFLNTSDLEVGLSEDETKWCAQYGYRTGIDDYCIERHYFSKKPTEKIIRKLIDLLEIQKGLELHLMDETYRCWECGCSVESWLDLDEDIYKCAKMARDQYCGC